MPHNKRQLPSGTAAKPFRHQQTIADMQRSQVQPVGHIKAPQCHALSPLHELAHASARGTSLESGSKGRTSRRTLALQPEQLTFFSMDRSCSSLMQLRSSALTSACTTHEPDVAG